MHRYYTRVRVYTFQSSGALNAFLNDVAWGTVLSGGQDPSVPLFQTALSGAYEDYLKSPPKANPWHRSVCACVCV